MVHVTDEEDTSTEEQCPLQGRLPSVSIATLNGVVRGLLFIVLSLAVKMQVGRNDKIPMAERDRRPVKEPPPLGEATILSPRANPIEKSQGRRGEFQLSGAASGMKRAERSKLAPGAAAAAGDRR
ncbi:hypothetical protein Anapl_16132 [Anas platyrhynchos]|uniref:Uncharacterized protein n=1 Tax=Anas platyrhynchos TaxID=8839 RepID=R0JXI6_ANAPL|nr:hypothetical protein Anapl_16132 [Anas platyrhynchos]